jgi:hypothetical protein
LDFQCRDLVEVEVEVVVVHRFDSQQDRRDQVMVV